MQRLIRAGIFTVARLALLLTVAVCIVAQFRAYQIDAWGPHGLSILIVCRTGVAINIRSDGISNAEFFISAFSTEATYSEESYSGLIDHVEGAFSESLVPRHWKTAIGEPDAYIGFPHWLTITTAILFYAFLKFIYRKRPLPESESASCDA